MPLFRGFFTSIWKDKFKKESEPHNKPEGESPAMARASTETSSILSTLHGIAWRHRGPNGVSRRPYGNDYVEFERYMGRLLVLRGVIPERGPHVFNEDPWTIYLREYGPVSSRPQDAYTPTSPTPAMPRSILQQPSSSGQGAAAPLASSSPAQPPSYATAVLPLAPGPAPASVPAPNVGSSDCHVRFAPDLPVRPQGGNGSGNTGRSGHIPRWVN